jgi:hypothetical protein
VGRAACLFLLAVSAAAQIPPGYELVQVSPPGVPCRDPDMNERGQIVFSAELGEPYVSREIMLYDPADGSLTQITNDNINDGIAHIGNDGTVTWSSFRGPPDRFGNPTGEIMIRTPDGVITQVTDNDVQDSPSDVDAYGRVVFKRYMDFVCGGASMDLFLYDGLGVVTITTSGLTESVANQVASINNAGEICWTEYDICTSPWTSRIMLYSNGVTRAISLPEMFEPQAPDINYRSQVVWQYPDAKLDDHVIVVWDNGDITPITTGRGTRMNDAGDISFSRWHQEVSAWQTWLYLDGREWRITDDDVWNNPYEINNRGEIVISTDQIGERTIHYLRRFATSDLNCDGAVDARDIEPFITALLDPVRYGAAYPACDRRLADVNDDGFVDVFDIEPFVNSLIP